MTGWTGRATDGRLVVVRYSNGRLRVDAINVRQTLAAWGPGSFIGREVVFDEEIGTKGSDHIRLFEVIRATRGKALWHIGIGRAEHEGR